MNAPAADLTITPSATGTGIWAESPNSGFKLKNVIQRDASFKQRDISVHVGKAIQSKTQQR
jgi:hypothetical protein